MIGTDITAGKYDGLFPSGCLLGPTTISAKVTDATDSPGRLTVYVTYTGAATGQWSMSYNSTTKRFEAKVTGAGIPQGALTITVRAKDPAGNRATPVTGPKLWSYGGCGG